jgi:serine/threonine protein kinase
VHRDLKPANIMIDRRGQVVITDFGLASTARDLKGADIRSGTPAYMAPEQLSGREVSFRSDIYSLGLVIYETVCGRRAFADRRDYNTAAPPIETMARDVDPAVARIIGRCLELDPSDRPASALAVAAELADGTALAEAVTGRIAPSPSLPVGTGQLRGSIHQRDVPRLLKALPWVVAAISLIALLVTLTRDTAPVPPLSKISVALPQPFVDSGRPSIALSPDGSRLAYVAQHGDSTAVYLRPVDGFESVSVPGTEGATSVLFSPDGEWIPSMPRVGSGRSRSEEAPLSPSPGWPISWARAGPAAAASSRRCTPRIS